MSRRSDLRYIFGWALFVPLIVAMLPLVLIAHMLDTWQQAIRDYVAFVVEIWDGLHKRGSKP